VRKAAIFIDDWKRGTFTRHLEEAGFDYQIIPGLSPNTLCIKARLTAELYEVVRAANTECATLKGDWK
jgi:hypothetical protein